MGVFHGPVSGRTKAVAESLCAPCAHGNLYLLHRYLTASYIMIPGNSEQAYNASHGFLPASRAAFKTGGADLSDPKWTVAGLQPYVKDFFPRSDYGFGAEIVPKLWFDK